MNDRQHYANPLIRRYASDEMGGIFSEQSKFRTWRRLWVILAEAEAALGLPIREEQLEELRAHAEDIDYARMEALERELRHDVMAAVRAYAEQCPSAGGIIHLGATSCYVTDNTELLEMHQALQLLRARLLTVVAALAAFAEAHKGLACLGYTHFQAAQPTTLGKRATLWLQDLLMVLEDLDHLLAGFRLRGVKGATGTQDSFLKLFGGDHGKVKALERLVCRKLGHPASFAVTGQTYPRLWDARVLDVLKNLALAAHKFAVDFRLMQHLKMVDEPFEAKQVGSSAMAYKRNPMRCERLCSLARYVAAQAEAAGQTAAQQWFERTLDDSAGRRLYIPQAFLGADAVLLIYVNVLKGARVYPRVIAALLAEEQPFLATETLLMRAVAEGADRQEVHEAIRQNAAAAAREIKEAGGGNRLLDMLAEDRRIPFDLEEIRRITAEADFTGRSEAQVEEYLAEVVRPLLSANRGTLAGSAGPAGEGEVRV